MYYICAQNTVKEHVKHIAVAHWIDLPDGSVLLSASFHTPVKQAQFESHPQVIALPHTQSGESVGDKVAAKLAHLGVTADHKVWDVAKLAAKQHAMMKIR
jgi:hypothetical protein